MSSRLLGNLFNFLPRASHLLGRVERNSRIHPFFHIVPLKKNSAARNRINSAPQTVPAKFHQSRLSSTSPGLVPPVPGLWHQSRTVLVLVLPNIFTLTYFYLQPNFMLDRETIAIKKVISDKEISRVKIYLFLLFKVKRYFV